MGPKNYFAAEFRQVAGRRRDGAPTRVVSATRTYNTQPVDLWDALTNPDRLKRWFSPISGDLLEGGRYQLEGNAGGVISQCEPPYLLVLTWEFGDSISWVSVTVAEHSSGAQLTLEHEMPTDPANEAHWAQYGAGATGVGWDLALLGLDWHTDGAADEYDQLADEAWASSPVGHRFIHGSAAAWADASISDGESPDNAKKQAGATADFYTGAG